MPPHTRQQALPLAIFDDNFRNNEERAKYKRSYVKRKIWDIRTIKMIDFKKAKFKYLTRFEKFGWMSYLTTKHPIHENLLKVFFADATLENTDEGDKDPCKVVVINTFVVGVPIRVIQGVVAQTFDIPDSGRSNEHEGFPMTMLIPNDNALDLPLHERLLHLFISHFFQLVGSKHTTVR